VSFCDNLSVFLATPFRTGFFNALSLQFPHGEQQVIDAVHLCQSKIEDPKLKAEICGLICQSSC
jgi:hypothetical protein